MAELDRVHFMSLSGRIAGLALSCALLAPGLAAADTYTLANFSAGIFGGGANVKSPFSGAGGFSPGQTFTGSFVYDNSRLPGNTGLVTNVGFASFPDIAQIPPATAFQLNFGSLTFDLGDAADPAAIQYGKTGAFNGFFYTSNFAFGGGNYQLQIQGGSLQVVELINGFPGFQGLINGYVNIGNANVAGGTPYTPPAVGGPGGPGVPEPATWAMLIMGFGGVGAVMRRRRGAPQACA